MSKRTERRATDIYLPTYIFANTLSWTLSKVCDGKGIDKNPYFSKGAGGFVGNLLSMPCAGVGIPLGAGFEGKKGFVDLGLELEGVSLAFPFFTPQLRAGIQF